MYLPFLQCILFIFLSSSALFFTLFTSKTKIQLHKFSYLKIFGKQTKMVAFELGFNKYFIRCVDTEALWVSKLSIDQENIDAFQEKDLTRYEGPIGPTDDYNSLKIGNQEISGSDLTKLIYLLHHSRLTVNREGICYLNTMGSPNGNDHDTAAEFQQQYQKIGSLFNWSNFQLINLASGSNSLQDCESNVRPAEKAELSILQKYADIQIDEKNCVDFFSEIVHHTRVPFPAKNFAVGSSEAQTEFNISSAVTEYGGTVQIGEVLTPVHTKPDTSSLPVVPVAVNMGDFDGEHWWVITVATRKSNGWETDVKRIIYYDHEVRSRRLKLGDRFISVPFIVGADLKFKYDFGVHLIHGTGVKFVFFV